MRSGRISKAVIEAGQLAAGDEGGDWYDYGNANDIENFVPDMANGERDTCLL